MQVHQLRASKLAGNLPSLLKLYDYLQVALAKQVVENPKDRHQLLKLEELNEQLKVQLSLGFYFRRTSFN